MSRRQAATCKPCNRDRFELAQGAHRDAAVMAAWRASGAGRIAFEVVHRIEHSDDPAFDVKAELATALQMWTTELGASPGNDVTAGE